MSTVEEKEYQTLSWLLYTVHKTNRLLVDTVWCQACRDHEEKICSMKNFSKSWIEGSTNHKTNNVTDHAKSDQHKVAMNNVRKAGNHPIESYSPIARCLLADLDETTQKRMERKFDMCYKVHSYL